MSLADRPKPMMVPETEFFFEGARAGELRIQRCNACDKAYFPPRPFCPECGSRDVSVIKASGRATLYSYIINHMPAPGYEPPFSVAVVTLEEGPRMMSNIVDCPQTPEAIQLDMDLEVTFEDRGDVTMPQFRPAGKDSA
ncbi:Zn-ribbon domain-containing OB-fold protein [Mameliella sediminis]|uniref:Zn-ribbon domain-containing OB-fold protein n=1 Tax=Mameliella sediminis TaxID=2836866 RepID=UPI001C4928CF|nr:Zn-ribbon domain-containing OB-fold protein [Mameliella sediminis]MBY6116041.1 Zn-ribbon domain-containing OB-fold protein [Antarctobacter heliothermus]MBY6145181.1 Zn-ribbon domain-containing OB-fold protein [Mameliella alba]MBV7394080.1 Zn-ribbon domain-containing OB-fold protein [Mameliella sediminis]MBY6162006.1 Zn-ribbon domain-containing OB-fold protein [Mameliella alba]MBY6170476.1 Zn-ribbon domain-containing OB-fold protein [Mameliella alba]